MKNKVTVSAPGKLMLFGEHAVVYGYPCVVTAVDQRMFVTIELTNTGNFELDAPDVNVVGYKKSVEKMGEGDIPKGAQFIEIAIKNVFKKYKPKTSGLKIKTRSEFSSKFGFGSSSASTVCAVKAISELFSLKLTSKQIFDLSFKTVLDIQKKGSGFDVAASIYGGTLYFVIGGKKIEPLKIKALPLIVGYSGIKADTVELINKVSKKAELYPAEIKGIYKLIGGIVEKARVLIEKNKWEEAGELMDVNQGLLESLGVSIDKLSQMIYGARLGGAYGAKLSGAGGGDCMITLSNDKNRFAVEKGIEKVGGLVLNVKTNVKGLRIEK